MSKDTGSDIGEEMAEPALRAFAVAGVLATGLFFGGLTAAPVHAQPDDSGGSSQDGGGSEGSDDSGGSGGGGEDSVAPNNVDEVEAPKPEDPPPPEPEPEENTRVEPGDSDDDGHDTGGGTITETIPNARESKKTQFNNSISLPMFRLPRAGEIPAGGWPDASSFLTTIEIPVPTFQEFLAALRIGPSPQPTPGPAFRTQEEAPVVDAVTGRTGNNGSVMSEPQVFQAPLVSVPRAVTIAGAAPKPVPEVPIGAAPKTVITQPGVAGARTPVIRGEVPPTPGVSTPPSVVAMNSLNSPVPRTAGFERFMRNPSVAELAVVALPGLAGLVLLTFGGGVVGYRQANSVRFVRTAGAERFLP